MRSRANIRLLVALSLSVGACKANRATTSASPDVGPPLPCQELRTRLCSQFGAHSDECDLADEQSKRFAPDRCLAMLAHYDDMAEAATRLAAGRKAVTSREQNTAHGPAPSLGNRDAPVTMVMFGDFDSPECARGSGIATFVRNTYAERVRFVFRQFPLSGNETARLAAEASLAAHAQGKFWRYYELLFGNQHAHGRPALERYAKEAGLDAAAFSRALDSHAFASDVDADRELGKKLDVRVLPALFVNGKQVRFPYGIAELKELIEGPSGGNDY
jgi:protein-disulfide isomerase